MINISITVNLLMKLTGYVGKPKRKSMKRGLILALVVNCGGAFAQQSDIDLQLNQCLNKASTTLAMVQCNDSAMKG